MWKKILKCPFRCIPSTVGITELSTSTIKNHICQNKKRSIRSLHQISKKIIESEENVNVCNKFTYRSHTCGELRPEHTGLKVTLCGWVQYSRLSKFIILRDSYGTTQCMFKDRCKAIVDIPLETIVKVNGEVQLRPENMVNSNMPTGEIEIHLDTLEFLNEVKDPLPFNLRDYQKAKEQLRLKHRYIDLRFADMQNNLRQRSSICHNFRRHLIERLGFVEVETPTLFCETPGGAREFVVPTHFPGLFYSLVQSPQQFKQMLMSGGVDRYFQIARCYRDETTRPDRQPEFTQLDIELSFCDTDDILSLVEQLLCESFTKPLPPSPFLRLTYQEAIESYGTDKPNLTYDMKFTNITHMFDRGKEFGAYMLPYSQSLNKITAKHKEIIQTVRKKYNIDVILNDQINKHLGSELHKQLRSIEQKPVIVAMGERHNACLCLGEIREIIAQILKSRDLLPTSEDLCPLWITNFPLFINTEDGLATCHHPFTAPHPKDLELLDSDPLKTRSLAYDLVINGNEVGGGSVRIHNADLQMKIFNILNIDYKNMEHFLNALKFGCPPHAGIALGLDRLVALACNADSLKDVIAFPKSHEGKDLLSNAPSAISEETLKYYHVKTVKTC